MSARLTVTANPATHREIVMLLCGVGWGLFAAASLLSDLHRQETRTAVGQANVEGYWRGRRVGLNLSRGDDAPAGDFREESSLGNLADEIRAAAAEKS